MSYGGSTYGVSHYGGKPLKLNVGCGLDYKEGFINIDSEPRSKADFIYDLEQPWNFPDGSVEYIEARHVLEHLHDLKTFLQEAYRVMQPDATMTVTVPHHCSDFYWGDPTHVRPITRAMMDLFSKKNCQEFAERKLSNSQLAVYWDIDFEVTRTEFAICDRWKDQFEDEKQAFEAIDMYNNVVSEVQFVLRRV